MHTTDQETFNNIVKEGIDAIDQQFRDKFDNVVFQVEDFPTREQIGKINLQRGHTLFGLYEGVSLRRRNSAYSGVLPDKITIFKKPIEFFSRDEEHLRTIVKNTVWHEIAHHFGMNEAEVRAAEKKRGHKY